MKLSAAVWWGNCLSCYFRVHSGVCQSVILFAYCFTCYIDPFIKALEGSGLGCWFRRNCAGCVLFADAFYYCLPQCLSYRVYCLSYRVCCLSYRVWCLSYRVCCLSYRVWCLSYRVCCLSYRVCCLSYRVWCLSYRVCCLFVMSFQFSGNCCLTVKNVYYCVGLVLCCLLHVN